MMIPCDFFSGIEAKDWLPTITAAILAGMQWYWNNQLKRRDEEVDLHKRLESILQLTITYPYLEDESITKHWNENMNSDSEKFMRYDQFCNILFNYLEDVYKFYNGDVEKIESFLDVRSWINLHKQIWKNPKFPGENTYGYCREFRDFLNSYLE